MLRRWQEFILTTTTSSEEMAHAAKSTGDKLASATEQITGAAAQVKTKVNDFGRATVDKIDEMRTTAANGLDTTASALHQGGAKLNSTADYLRSHDAKGMICNVQSLIKNNPVPSLIAAAAVGFLLGRALNSRD